MTKYKDCPFCGGKAKRNDKLTKGVIGVIKCQECGACAFTDKWNNRINKEE